MGGRRRTWAGTNKIIREASSAQKRGWVRRLIFKEKRRGLRGVFSLMREVRAPFSPQKIILHNIERGRPPDFFPALPRRRGRKVLNTHMIGHGKELSGAAGEGSRRRRGTNRRNAKAQLEY